VNELEVHYRRLLAAYPPDHRAAHDGEMLGTLLDAAEPGRRRPTARESVAIVTHGLAYRYRAATEWRLGLRLAGAISLALATVLAVAALGIASLPPVDNPAGTQNPSWLPIATWLLALAAIVAGARIRRVEGRVLVPVVAATALVLGGPDLTGMPRTTYLPAFGALLVLSSIAPRLSWRRQTAAASVGAAVGAVLVHRFVDEYRSAGRDERFARVHEQLWTTFDRWDLASDLVPMRPGIWVACMAAGLLIGLVRPRFAVAAGLLAAPLGLLTVHYARIEDVREVVLPVLIGTAFLFAVAATRQRAPRPRSPEDAVTS
jgi:hypothetical protein